MTSLQAKYDTARPDPVCEMRRNKTGSSNRDSCWGVKRMFANAKRGLPKPKGTPRFHASESETC